jgi:hypothetical protein
MDISRDKSVYRKWFGVLLLLIEMNLLGGTIFGFPAIFKILTKSNIYQHLCQTSTTNQCSQQIQQYQVNIYKIEFFLIIFFKNAMTLGIAFFDLPALVIGILIDKFGCRFVKLISM